MKTIQLSQKGKRFKGLYFAEVDDEDFQWLNLWKWQVFHTGNNIYARRVIDRDKNIFMHREILKRHNILDRSKIIDHRDHNGLNNRKSNLRHCTYSQNFQNKRAKIGAASKYKGVGIQNGGGGKWRAQIFVDGKQKVLGTFNDEIEAAKVYDAAAKKYFGEFAYTNF